MLELEDANKAAKKAEKKGKKLDAELKDLKKKLGSTESESEQLYLFLFTLCDFDLPFFIGPVSGAN
mgnify:CR=1 FL=1